MIARRGLQALLLGVMVYGVMWGAPNRALALDDACRSVDRFGWAAPDHVKVQTGGYLGFITVGVGYSALQRIDVDLYYGWVPSPIGGNDIHSLALRVSGHVATHCVAPNLRWRVMTVGLGAMTTFGRGFFLLSPDPYPANYYPITALRSFLSLGTEFALTQADNGLFSAHGGYVELTTLDQYMFAWLDNLSTIAPWEIWSLSLGYKASF